MIYRPLWQSFFRLGLLESLFIGLCSCGDVSHQDIKNRRNQSDVAATSVQANSLQTPQEYCINKSSLDRITTGDSLRWAENQGFELWVDCGASSSASPSKKTSSNAASVDSSIPDSTMAQIIAILEKSSERIQKLGLKQRRIILADQFLDSEKGLVLAWKGPLDRNLSKWLDLLETVKELQLKIPRLKLILGPHLLTEETAYELGIASDLKLVNYVEAESERLNALSPYVEYLRLEPDLRNPYFYRKQFAVEPHLNRDDFRYMIGLIESEKKISKDLGWNFEVGTFASEYSLEQRVNVIQRKATVNRSRWQAYKSDSGDLGCILFDAKSKTESWQEKERILRVPL